jgi:O-acetylhomoserine/O-acetylserine sulfhydrylase-like pyridoxal-dependent enzyme
MYNEEFKNREEQAEILRNYALRFKDTLSNILMEIVSNPEQFVIDIKSIQRICAKMHDNDITRAGLRLFDIIRA